MIFLLPNLFTTLNLFCGFYATISSFQGYYERSGFALFLAIIFDIFDGRMARLTKNTSKFGKEYDSLADMVSFGMAPSLLIYNFSLKEFTKLGWLASFLYTACVALRLARFNVKTSSTHYFEGLPSPAGAAIVASTILLLLNLNIELPYKNWSLLTLTYLLAFLFVSSIKYPAFKEIKIKSSQTFYFLVLFILMLTLTASNPPLLFFVFVALYIALGPFIILKERSNKIFKKIIKKVQKTKVIDNN